MDSCGLHEHQEVGRGRGCTWRLLVCCRRLWRDVASEYGYPAGTQQWHDQQRQILFVQKCMCSSDGMSINNIHGLFFHVFPPSVERYNPQENRWHTVSPMGTRRKHLGCAVYQDMIYSVGGRDDTTELSSAERYNPRTNQWSPVVAMTSRRSGVSGPVANITIFLNHDYFSHSRLLYCHLFIFFHNVAVGTFWFLS